jgi:predicted porin
MKKTLALTALAAATTSVCAQSSNLTVYGILDVGVTQVSGLRGGTQKAVVSGIMDGSRLGFRGNEDLGGGYRALFTIEHRLELDTGDIKNRPFSGSQVPDRLADATLLGVSTALQNVVSGAATAVGDTIGVNQVGNMWDRQAFVGLVTPFGAVLAGRQYTPAYEASAAFDTLGTQSALSAGQAAAFPPAIDIRLSNALAYRIQTGPFTASAMVTAAERSTTFGKMAGAMGIYKVERFSVGLGYNARENELGQKSLQSTVVGASLVLGPGTAFAQVTQVKDDNPSGLSLLAPGLVARGGATALAAAAVAGAFVNALRQDAQINHVGYRLTTGPHTIYGAYTQFNDKRPANADVASYGAAYTYALSKRTSLNAVAAHFDNKGLAQAAPGQAGFIGGVTATAGTDSNSFALGIRHSF